jgi:hypothetical protein
MFALQDCKYTCPKCACAVVPARIYSNHRKILAFFSYKKRRGGSCLKWAWESQK